MKMKQYAGLLCVCLLLTCLGAFVGCTKEDGKTENTDSMTESVTQSETDTDTDHETESLSETPTESESKSETATETQDDADDWHLSFEEIEFCHYNYPCVKSVNEVVADGVYHVGEWDEAVELVINNDTIRDWGRWQAGEPIDAADLSISLRLKWDEEYLYILEIRTDTNYVYEFGDKGYDAFSDVWGADATALFFCDGLDITRSNRCDIGYFSYVDKLGGPSVYVGSFDGETYAFRGPSGKDGCTYGGTLDGEGAVFEMKLPWAIMEDQGKLISDIEAGALFRFSPVIPSVDTQAGLGAYNSEWRQMNFHDCVNNGENGNPDDPMYWGALTLVETAPEE